MYNRATGHYRREDLNQSCSFSVSQLSTGQEKGFVKNYILGSFHISKMSSTNSVKVDIFSREILKQDFNVYLCNHILLFII